MFNLDALDNTVILTDGKLILPPSVRTQLGGRISKISCGKKCYDYATSSTIEIKDEPLTFTFRGYYMNFFGWQEGYEFTWEASPFHLILTKVN